MVSFAPLLFLLAWGSPGAAQRVQAQQTECRSRALAGGSGGYSIVLGTKGKQVQFLVK